MKDAHDMKLKIGLAEMLKGGVIMDVTTPDQAKIAQDAGAVSVMALERIPADIRAQGGIARMSNPTVIKAIQKSLFRNILSPILTRSAPYRQARGRTESRHSRRP